MALNYIYNVLFCEQLTRLLVIYFDNDNIAQEYDTN